MMMKVFLYPLIDSNVCVNCNKCQEICPVNNPELNEELFNKYAPVTFRVRLEKFLRNLFAKLGIYYKIKRGK